MNEINPASNELQIGEPAWRMALLFPPQGSWTEQEYLALDAGIPEYWIVDPLESRVLAHYLVDSEYTCTAFTGGQNVPSKILSGFTVAVSELFAAAQ